MAAQAFVLAAGFGTRLRPLTLDRPKPLVPVCNRPLLDYAVALCHQYGITEILVNAHYKHEQVEAYGRAHDGIDVLVEWPDIKGTGGGLKAVQDQISDRIVVLNGDVLHTVDLSALLASVPDGGGALVLRPHATDAERYGHVSADSTDTVVKMRDFASTEPIGEVRHDTHFTGIHALHRGLLDDAVAGFSDILRTAHKARITNRVIKGMRYDGPWLDIGDPKAYLETNMAILNGEISLPLDPLVDAAPQKDGVTLIGSNCIHPTAQIAMGAVLENVVVGAGSRIGPVTLKRSVIWDGTTVETDLTDAIVHDSGIHTL